MAEPVKYRRAILSWEGDSRDVVCGWPKLIRQDFGVALDTMQEGKTVALPVRPMTSIAAGVFELKDADESKWYRLIYLARRRHHLHPALLHQEHSQNRQTRSGDSRAALEASQAPPTRGAET